MQVSSPPLSLFSPLPPDVGHVRLAAACGDSERSLLRIPLEDGRVLVLFSCLLERRREEPSERPYYHFLHPPDPEAGDGKISVAELAQGLREKGVAVLLNQGGYFHGAIFWGGTDKCQHKGFRRYVTRRGQGHRQSKHAGKKGTGKCRSAGGRLRAFNEVKHRDEIAELLEAWEKELQGCAAILLACPGQNRETIVSHPAMQQLKDRIHKVPITTFRPSLAECVRVFQTVTSIGVQAPGQEETEAFELPARGGEDVVVENDDSEEGDDEDDDGEDEGDDEGEDANDNDE